MENFPLFDPSIQNNSISHGKFTEILSYGDENRRLLLRTSPNDHDEIVDILYEHEIGFDPFEFPSPQT